MKINKQVIPTIFANTKKEFTRKFNLLTKTALNLQVDFMDGKFVNGKSAPLNVIPNLNKYDNIFEAHLMVKNPREWITKCKNLGFNRIIFHIESVLNTEEAEDIIESIKVTRMACYIAINPETPLERIFSLVKEERVDGVLIMGVHPGKEGQKLVENVFDRIKKIKRVNINMIVQIDGGINDKTISKIVSAGADIVNVGSYINKDKNPEKALDKLEGYFNN